MKPFRISPSNPCTHSVIVLITILSCCFAKSCWAFEETSKLSSATRFLLLRETIEQRELADTDTNNTTATTTVLPATAPNRHTNSPPDKEVGLEQNVAVDEYEHDIDSSISVDGAVAIGDEDSENIGGKLTATVDNDSTTLDDSSYHGLFSLLFIALCAGLFIAGAPSSITQCRCYCFENMYSEPDDKHQLHGSVKQRINTFNHLIGENKREGNSASLKSGLTNEDGEDQSEVVVVEVDEKKGIDHKQRRSFGLRLFDVARNQKLIRSPLRREKKSQQKEVINNNDNDHVVVSDVYVRAEEQVQFQKV